MTNNKMWVKVLASMRNVWWFVYGMFFMFLITRADYITNQMLEPSLLNMLIVIGALTGLGTMLLVYSLSVYFIAVWAVGFHNRDLPDDAGFMDGVVPALIWPHTALMDKIKGDKGEAIL